MRIDGTDFGCRPWEEHPTEDARPGHGNGAALSRYRAALCDVGDTHRGKAHGAALAALVASGMLDAHVLAEQAHWQRRCVPYLDMLDKGTAERVSLERELAVALPVASAHRKLAGAYKARLAYQELRKAVIESSATSVALPPAETRIRLGYVADTEAEPVTTQRVDMSGWNEEDTLVAKAYYDALRRNGK